MKHTCYNKLIINSSGVRQSARNCRRHSEPAKQSNPCWKPAKGWQRKWRTRPCARQVFEIWEPVSFDIQEMLLFPGGSQGTFDLWDFSLFFKQSIRLSVSLVFVYHSDFSTCTFFSLSWVAYCLADTYFIESYYIINEIGVKGAIPRYLESWSRHCTFCGKVETTI